jgi:D-proline reductase (dithiol) PrdB
MQDTTPIQYIPRIRAYYQALGYGAPYEWAHFDDVPFAPLAKPLARSRVALIVTAAPFNPDAGDQGPTSPMNARAKFVQAYSGDVSRTHDLRNRHVAIDFAHAKVADMNAYFPLQAMREASVRGRIGSVAQRFHGAPTNRSQRTTLERDAPEILARCQADGVDAAVLVPNCPVCHQTVSIVARVLEAAGISTVIMGSAKDIVEHVGVPRLLFSDFPLGHAAGRPNDPESQATTLELALKLLETATAPRTTVQSPLEWREDHSWKQDYSNAARLSPEEIARRRAEFDKGKAEAKALRNAPR